MAWVDSHCHLDFPTFEHDLADVLDQAQQQGITRFIVAGVQAKHWVRQQQVQQQYPQTFHAFGVHPWYCDQHQAQDLQLLETLLPHAVAVGECGLDLMPNRPHLEVQLWWFKAQLKLASQHNLPVIIHAVKAVDLVCKHLKEYPNIRGVIHGFSGSLQQAKTFINMGFYLGIGTRFLNTSTKKAHLFIKKVPLTSLLLETDAPDGLANGERNEPKHIIQVAKNIARLRNQDSAVILSTCSQNTRELFQL